MDKPRFWSGRSPLILALVVVLVAVALRLTNLTFHSLDLDESVSVWLAHKPAGELIRNTLNLAWDPHPPAYYLLLKAWMAVFGDGEIAVRLLSALFGIAFVGLVYLIGRELFDDPWVGLIAAGLCAVNPLLVWLSQEVRMYMPVAALAAGSLYCLFHATRRNLVFVKNQVSDVFWWIGYGVLALIACYAHLFAVLLLPVAAIYVFVRGWRQRVLWVISAAVIVVVALAYLPFAWNAWRSGQVAPEINVYPLLSFKDQVYHLALAFTARSLPDSPPWLWAPIALLGALIVFGLWPDVRSRSDAQGHFPRLFLAVCLVVPLLAFFLIIAKRPAFNPKYMVVILPAFWLAVAAGIVRLKRWTIWPAVAALIPALVLAGLGWRYVWNVKMMREDWRTAAQYVMQRATAEDKVFVHLHYAHIPFDYYYQGAAEVVAPLGSRPPATEDLDGLLSPYGGASVLWLVQSQEWNTDPKHVVQKWFSDRGPLITEQYLVGMTIKAYALRYRLGGVPEAATSASIQFGERLRLVGYQIDQSRLSPTSERLHPPSNWIHLTLYWQVDQPLEDEMVTVVEMTDDNGGVWGGKLEQSRNVLNYYRPSQWQPGEVIRDDYDINLNPVTPTGMYHLRVGVKTPQMDMFWPASGAAVQQERAILSDVHIGQDSSR